MEVNNNKKIINYESGYVIKSAREGIYVLLDNNYNVIGIRKYNTMLGKEVKMELECYENGLFPKLSYPFNNYTIKDIIDLSSRIEDIDAYDEDNVLLVKMDGTWQSNNDLEDGIYLLAYAKFLGEELKDFNRYARHMISLNGVCMNESDYLNHLINEISHGIKSYINKKIIPCPSDILNLIGENPSEEKTKYFNYQVLMQLVQDLKKKKSNLEVVSDELLYTVKGKRGRTLHRVKTI